MVGGSRYKWHLNADGSANFPWMWVGSLYTNKLELDKIIIQNNVISGATLSGATLNGATLNGNISFSNRYFYLGGTSFWPRTLDYVDHDGNKKTLTVLAG
jgi:hypothetical protein